ncbi:ABC transporter family substrate-binding protein [Bifidobacterium sp. 82T10]|uniref:ABC transporter family substrate-binding protein n=1 Tax=Bifidobacterium miconis TaxID=2834435 RepID=A0ABS6WFI5_9BIFI|nr:ABC transporter family substrate-binding protein [Bifidobacterium miconis]MBW3092622.1 ABC transporter family substrate-binding protein [Bifidobacterium miconis]
MAYSVSVITRIGRSIIRPAVAALGAVALAVSLGACGATNGGSTATLKTEAASGTPSSYKGALPMPSASKAYNNTQPRDNIKQGGTLTLPISSIGPNFNLNTTAGFTAYTGYLWQMYLPRLWDFSIDGGKVTPNPDYLTSVKLTSTNPETVVYDINPKANWNDGTPIDWTAFETVWKTMNGKNAAYSASTTTGYSNIASVKRGKDDKQAVVTFSKPFYPYESLFGYLMHPKNQDPTVFAQGWANNPHNEWGAGPFVVSSFDESQIVFTPNPKWWGNKPKLDKVTFKAMEVQAASNAFQNGEIDASGASTADTIKSARNMKNVSLRIGYGNSLYYIVLNVKSAPLDDLSVRKAISQAVDRKQLSTIKFQGTDWNQPVTTSNVILPFQKGYENNFPSEGNYNPASAKKTLESAGYKLGSDGYYEKGGKELEVKWTMFSDDSTTTAIAKAFQSMLKKSGIKADLDVQSGANFSKVLADASWQAMALGGENTDPFGYSTAGSGSYGSDAANEWGGTPEQQKVLDQVSAEPDADKARDLFNKLEKSAMKRYTRLPMWNGPTSFAVKDGLANFGPAGFEASGSGMLLHVEDVGWQK